MKVELKLNEVPCKWNNPFKKRTGEYWIVIRDYRIGHPMQVENIIRTKTKKYFSHLTCSIGMRKRKKWPNFVNLSTTINTTLAALEVGRTL